jgi:hypothetical protein
MVMNPGLTFPFFFFSRYDMAPGFFEQLVDGYAIPEVRDWVLNRLFSSNTTILMGSNHL